MKLWNQEFLSVMIYHTGFHPLVFFTGNRDHDKSAVTAFYFSKRYVRATIGMTTGMTRCHGYSVQFVPRGLTKHARVFMADISMTLFVRIGQDNLDGQQLKIRHYDGRIGVIFLIRFYEVNKVSGFFGCIVQINSFCA